MFLLGLEATSELSWREQRWGRHFLEAEQSFVAVYEPYCKNWAKNIRIQDSRPANGPSPVSKPIARMQEKMRTWDAQLINFKSELPAFIVKPVSRVCKYPLLIDSLLKETSPETYPYYDELSNGLASMKRVVDKINAAERQVENIQLAASLCDRVIDWKGLNPATFGALLLDDIHAVSKDDKRRECYVFLFEEIVLFCVSAPGFPPVTQQFGNPHWRPWQTPLALKSHIFVADIMQTQSPETLPNTSSYPFELWCTGKENSRVQLWTIHMRYTSHREQWETEIKPFILKCAERRAHERSLRRTRRVPVVSTEQAEHSGFDSDDSESADTPTAESSQVSKLPSI
ncbi:Dbl homology domain-containing protein [Favolaschia claudopus]|uniref:Dbl homology domain-containing protein n=1 Tax=Favolaschia claudopus TaxID=2862362 RepID=A0AAW0BNQ2_9AGAR